MSSTPANFREHATYHGEIVFKKPNWDDVKEGTIKEQEKFCLEIAKGLSRDKLFLLIDNDAVAAISEHMGRLTHVAAASLLVHLKA